MCMSLVKLVWNVKSYNISKIYSVISLILIINVVRFGVDCRIFVYLSNKTNFTESKFMESEL